MVQWIIWIFLGLLILDFLLIWGKTRKFISKLLGLEIKERQDIPDNLMVGLLSGFLVSAVLSQNSLAGGISIVSILLFLIIRGFNYKKKK
jgi:hypothetical protein